MAHIYAMSDIHGELDAFKEALGAVDLREKASKLILLGDYIDRGSKSCATLYFIKKLQEKYPEQLVVLRGNHEEMFLEQFGEDDVVFTADAYHELQNYLSPAELDGIIDRCGDDLPIRSKIPIIYREMLAVIAHKHKELIDWLRGLPYFYESEYNQIYVHAGVDEEADDYWKWGVENSYFVWKYPHVTGPFYKDIVAGHVHTSEIAGDESHHRVYWDGENHFYIDGHTTKSHCVPVLKYDTATGRYSSFERMTRDDGSTFWREYPIEARE